MRQVHSPFELESQHPDPEPSPGRPHSAVVDWEQLDNSVWQTCKSLLLLPADVVDASMKIPFDIERHARHPGSILCGQYCNIQNGSDLSEECAKTSGIEDLQVQKAATSNVDEMPLPALNLQQVAEASNLESANSVKST